MLPEGAGPEGTEGTESVVERCWLAEPVVLLVSGWVGVHMRGQALVQLLFIVCVSIAV